MIIESICIKERDQNINNFCPMCGTHNHGLKGVNPCDHLLFIYLNSAEGIQYIREDIAPILDDCEDDFEVVDLLQKLQIENSFILEESGSLTGVHFMIAYDCSDDD